LRTAGNTAAITFLEALTPTFDNVVVFTFSGFALRTALIISQVLHWK